MDYIAFLMDQNSAIGASITYIFIYLFTTCLSVFIMVDPLAAIPVYLLLTERFTPSDVKKTRRKAVLIATSILLVFAFTGAGVLNLFGISISALRIAGGILLLRFALQHMMGSSEKIKHEEEDESKLKDDISIVPLAMPLLAGPGAISTIVLQSTNPHSIFESKIFKDNIVKNFFFNNNTLNNNTFDNNIFNNNTFNFCLLILSIIIVMWLTAITLKYSQYLFRLLGKTGLNLMGRIMGILIAGIAIEFILIGIKDTFFPLFK